MNEYDYITRINNFNLSEVLDSMNTLSGKELGYLYSIAIEACGNITEEDKLAKKIKNLV